MIAPVIACIGLLSFARFDAETSSAEQLETAVRHHIDHEHHCDIGRPLERVTDRCTWRVAAIREAPSISWATRALGSSPNH